MLETLENENENLNCLRKPAVASETAPGTGTGTRTGTRARPESESALLSASQLLERNALQQREGKSTLWPAAQKLHISSIFTVYILILIWHTLVLYS